MNIQPTFSHADFAVVARLELAVIELRRRNVKKAWRLVNQAMDAAQRLDAMPENLRRLQDVITGIEAIMPDNSPHNPPPVAA